MAKSAVVSFVVAVLALGACQSGESPTQADRASAGEALTPCERLVGDLSHFATVKKALDGLGEDPASPACPGAFPLLAELFDGGYYRAEILASLGRMPKPTSAKAGSLSRLIRQGLHDEESAAAAIALIGQWELSEMRSALETMLSEGWSPSANLPALRTLLRFAQPEELEDVLVTLACGEHARQSPQVNLIAAEALADIRSASGLPCVLKATLLTRQGCADAYPAMRRAFAQLGGAAAAELLVRTIQGKNDDLRAFARERGLQEWEWTDGPRIVQLIGDLADPSTQAAVARNMAKRLVEPAGLTERLVDAWRIAQSNRLTIDMLTLARIADDTVIPILAPVITDPANDIKQRLDSASVLAAVGSRASVDALLKIYEDSDDQHFKAPLLRPLTQALDSAHLERFDKAMKADEEKGYELTKQRLEADPLVMGAIAVVRECAGDDTTCLIENLSAEPEKGEDGRPLPGSVGLAQGKQWKAVMVLARKKDQANAVLPELLKYFERTDGRATDLRNYALLALERLGRLSPRVYEGLAEILERERMKPGYGFWNRELEVRVLSFAARSERSDTVRALVRIALSSELPLSCRVAEDRPEAPSSGAHAGEMVDRIDTKKVGLNDLLSTSALGGKGAISNILSRDASGFNNKLAVAMSGTGSEFVMGHGSGGLGFQGTGTGGGGTGGYGRIHGLGKIDTGGGVGVRASMGRKRGKRVGKVKFGGGASQGFCSRGDISKNVRMRAGAIRACYERRLQVKTSLAGEVTIRWTIHLDGSVKAAAVASSTLGDSSVENCILRTIRRIHFKKPEGGICIVKWPFVFSPE